MSTKHIYPQHVTAIFQKQLDGSQVDWLSYETRLADQWGNDDAVKISLQLTDLIYKERTDEWLITHQPNALKLLKGKIAKLAMFYGLSDGISKDTKQSISIGKEDEVFILWRIEKLDFLNGVANALTRKGFVWITIDMFCDDSYFDDFEHGNGYNVNLYKISINFSDKEID